MNCPLGYDAAQGLDPSKPEFFVELARSSKASDCYLRQEQAHSRESRLDFCSLARVHMAD